MFSVPTCVLWVAAFYLAWMSWGCGLKRATAQVDLNTPSPVRRPATVARVGPGDRDVVPNLPVPAVPPQGVVLPIALAPPPVQSVDPELTSAADRADGRYYLWTVCTNESGYKQPDAIGREGLYLAIKRAFQHVFPNPEHPCHNGPSYGEVAREGGHPNALTEEEKQVHLHAATESPHKHRWKGLESHLRTHEQIKASS